MKFSSTVPRPLAGLAAAALLLLHPAPAAPAHGRLLYVATPGIRDDLEAGGFGVLVFDIDRGHHFVRRIASSGVDEGGKPRAVKGICACAATGRLYLSNPVSLVCFDLATDRILWEKAYPGGCDRMAISPDGRTIYQPSYGGNFWDVIDAQDGNLIGKITAGRGAHNTIAGPDGREVYLAGLESPILTVAEMRTNSVLRTVGPFSNVIRPFTINGGQSVVYVNVNGLLGFEMGDLRTGRVLASVRVIGYEWGAVKRHNCPSHGIALTRDEGELWVADAHNRCIHVFDNRVMPPVQKTAIRLRDEPGWITFGIDGRLAYPSTGDVVDVRTKRIVATLEDEKGRQVQSEKLLEIDFDHGRPIRAGNQFAIGGG